MVWNGLRIGVGIGLCNLVKYSPMRRLTILARPNRFKRRPDDVYAECLSTLLSLYSCESVCVYVCVCGFLCRCLSAVLLHVVGWLVVVKATVPAPDKPDRQMDTHTSIIIINSMKGNSDSNGDGGNLLALTVLCSAVFHEVCNIFYACAAGGDCETTAIKKREETYN